MSFSCTIPAVPTVQVDDDRVRITRWDFAPEAHIGWHEHGMPDGVVMVIGGTLAVDNGERETRVTLAAGDSDVRPQGITHDVMNASPHPIAFVEIEMKR